MTRIFVKPAPIDDTPDSPARFVSDPATRKALPDKGAWVEDSIYWRRRFEEQDVVDDTEAEVKREAAEIAAANKAAKGLKKEGDL